MTSLEAKIAALLVECEKVLKPTNVVAHKWILISKTNKQLQPIQDNRAALSFSYGFAHEKITALKSFSIAKEAFERDNVFSDAVNAAGYWATFEAVLRHLIVNAGEIRKNRVSINQTEALKYLRSFRSILTSRHIEYEARARLFGVNLKCKSLHLPDGVTLYRLNRKEINDRQPIMQPYLSHSWEAEMLGNHPAELRVPVTVPVDSSQDSAFFKAQNDAIRVATEIFTKIQQSILFTSSGYARLGSVELKGGSEQMPIGQTVNREFTPFPSVILGAADVSKIQIAYDLISGGKKSDQTISRALRRYILGRQRPHLIDKLVDYVIAWEAILLTQSGNPIHQELSYRFALNGAFLISKVRKDIIPNVLYKKMRSAYATRSSIIHGAGDRNIDEELRKGDFDNLSELCDFLEERFRLSVFWLSSIKAKDRPYRQAEGWEFLVWPKN